MATANFNEPEQPDMLWVTEGLTEYWRGVLAVRAGLVTRQEYLDGMADLTALMSSWAGASWRPLQDVGADAIMASSSPEPWNDWRRAKSDTYGQGELIWLEVDALIRERTGGRRSLDDFANSFFGVRSGALRTYTLPDIADALNRIAPYDWAAFFRSRVDPLRRRARSGDRDADGQGCAVVTAMLAGLTATVGATTRGADRPLPPPWPPQALSTRTTGKATRRRTLRAKSQKVINDECIYPLFEVDPLVRTVWRLG